ncbi:hypothetical protein ACWEIJ_28895 [Lentzea sp. NPDC004789]
MPTTTGPATASGAAYGRPVFLNNVVNTFVQNFDVEVPDQIMQFILREVLEPDEKWDESLRLEQFDPEKTAHILHEALAEALVNRSEPRLDEVSDAFYRVIHDRWKCPFPFIFC